MTTLLHTPPKFDSASPPQYADRAELIRRVSQLRAALDAATRENGRHRRELHALRSENRRLREQFAGGAVVRARDGAAVRAREERRRLLSEPWSRNP